MNIFYQYLEWLPKKFNDEREKGTFDTTLKKQNFSFLKHLMPDQDVQIIKNIDLNSNEDLRIVIVGNDWYGAESYNVIHANIVAWLMKKLILVPNEKTFSNWETLNIDTNNFLCLDIISEEPKKVFLSETYNPSSVEGQTFKKFLPTIKKMNRTLIKNNVWRLSWDD